MSTGEQKADKLQQIGQDFEKFLKSQPKTTLKSFNKNKALMQAKKDGLKKICVRHSVDYNKVWKIFLTN